MSDIDRSLCQCQCDTCLDSDCEGHVCRPHEPGRWLVESRFMAHPIPGDFDTREAAEEFVEATGIRGLSVRQHQ